MEHCALLVYLLGTVVTLTISSSSQEQRKEEVRIPLPEDMQKSKFDFTNLLPTRLMGGAITFDGDNTDIDDYDFGLEDWNESEDNIKFSDKEFNPQTWILILNNYINNISGKEKCDKNKSKLQKAKDLKRLEQRLVDRGAEKYTKDDADYGKWTRWEYDIFSHIRRMPDDEKKVIFDLDGDGKPDIFV